MRRAFGAIIQGSQGIQEGMAAMGARILRGLCVGVTLLVLIPMSARAANPGMSILSIVTAADYTESHTVFAMAQRSDCQTACAELLVSRDGGATWAQAAAKGWQQGPVIALRVAGKAELATAVSGGFALSQDGGETFRAYAAPGSPTASAVTGAETDLVLMGSDRSSDYVIGLPGGTAHRIPGDPSLQQVQVAPTPVYGRPSGDVPAAIAVGLEPNSNTPRLDWCNTSLTCTAETSISSGGQLVFSPSFADDLSLFFLTPKGLLWSADGGRTLVPTTVMPASADTLITTITALAVTPDFDRATKHGAVFAAVMSASKSKTNTVSGGVFRSGDGGTTWQSLGGSSPLASGVSALTLAPDGRLFAGTMAFAGSPGGVYCSEDGGTTWKPACTPLASSGAGRVAQQDDPSRVVAPTPTTPNDGGKATPSSPPIAGGSIVRPQPAPVGSGSSLHGGAIGGLVLLAVAMTMGGIAQRRRISTRRR